MNTTFFSEMLQSIADRGRALIQRREPSRERSAGLLELCEALLSGRGEASGVALASDILGRYEDLTIGPRIAFFEALATTFGSDRARIEKAIKDWQQAPSDETAAELHHASEPRRLELFRRLNLAPGGTAALVRMREQLIDAMDHRDDLGVIDNDFVHLFSSWFNRGFLVLRRIDWSSPAIDPGKDHPLRSGARDPRLGRSAPPHRSAGPALLRILPSGAGRRAADLRRSGAHSRDSGGDRADPVRQTR